MTKGNAFHELQGDLLPAGTRITSLQESPFRHNMSMIRKPRTLPPIGESCFDRPRTPLAIPDNNTRKRSPRLKTQDRPLTQQSVSHNASIPLNFPARATPSISMHQASFLRSSMSDLRSHSPSAEISRSDDYIKSLLKQNRDTMMSLQKNFDKLCENLVSQREEMLLARKASQSRCKTPSLDGARFQQASKQNIGSDYMNLPEKVKLESQTASRKSKPEAPSLGIRPSGGDLIRRNTYTIPAPEGESDEYLTQERQVHAQEVHNSEISRPDLRPDRPKSAKYGRGRPPTGYGRRTEVTME